MATIKITIEKHETVQDKQKIWNRLHDDSTREHQYGYVEETLPFTVGKVLLEQTLDADVFDLNTVIKAINRL